MYGKVGNLKLAQNTFDRMPERDTVSWNAMMGVCALNGQAKDAISLLDQMEQESSIPDKVTVVSMLDACASQAALIEGRRFHACIVGTGFESDIVVGTSLLNLYGRSGSLDLALQMFDKMPEQNLVAWNSMMAVYAQHGEGRAAVGLFNKMKQEGVIPNKATFVSILSACSHAGLVDEACHCFISMIQMHEILPVVDHYNCIVDLLGRAGRLHEAEVVIYHMPLNPTNASLMTLLGACRCKVDVERGERSALLGFKLDPDSAVPYVMLSNIYSTAREFSSKEFKT